jgi:hypothetical protein
MLDFEALVYQLLSRGLPQARVVPELDVGDLDFNEPEAMPLVMFTITPGAAVPGSLAPPQAWDCTLFFNVFEGSRDEAAALATAVYELVWSWNNPWATAHIVDGIGYAAEIEDQSVFSRIITGDVGARTITHYSGGFGLQLHTA